MAKKKATKKKVKRKTKPQKTRKTFDANKGIGRPSLFNEERRQAIYDSLHDCPFLNPAAGLAGISRRTLDYWLQQGGYDQEKNIDSEYARFLRMVQELRSRAEADTFAVVKTQAAKDWNAARYVLQCLDGKTYGTKQAIKTEDDNTEDGAVSNLNARLAQLVSEAEKEKGE